MVISRHPDRSPDITPATRPEIPDSFDDLGDKCLDSTSACNTTKAKLATLRNSCTPSSEKLGNEKLKKITNEEFLEIPSEERLQYVSKNNTDSCTLSSESLGSITSKEFLQIPFEERLGYVSKNNIDSKNIASGEVKDIEFTFTYDGSFNKDLYMLTTAGQVLPSEVRSVVKDGVSYSRSGVKGEFFDEAGNRLTIHEGTVLNNIEVGDITEILKANSSKVSKYMSKNPDSKKDKGILSEAFSRGIDPKLAIIAFSDYEKREGTSPDKKKVSIEQMFTQFDRIRGNNPDWDGGLLDNGRYPDDIVLMLLKEFGGDSWEQKGISYGIEKDIIDEAEKRSSLGIVSFKSRLPEKSSNGITLCSKTARLNLSDLGVKNPSTGSSARNAFLNLGSNVETNLGKLMGKGNNVVDLYLSASDTYREYGHRVVAVKKDNGWIVYDPYYEIGNGVNGVKASDYLSHMTKVKGREIWGGIGYFVGGTSYSA